MDSLLRLGPVVTIILGSAALTLAGLLWTQLRYTRPGKLLVALMVVIAAFVTEHAVLLVLDPGPLLVELSRSILLLALLALVGFVVLSRRSRTVSDRG